MDRSSAKESSTACPSINSALLTLYGASANPNPITQTWPQSQQAWTQFGTNLNQWLQYNKLATSVKAVGAKGNARRMTRLPFRPQLTRAASSISRPVTTS